MAPLRLVLLTSLLSFCLPAAVSMETIEQDISIQQELKVKNEAADAQQPHELFPAQRDILEEAHNEVDELDEYGDDAGDRVYINEAKNINDETDDESEEELTDSAQINAYEAKAVHGKTILSYGDERDSQRKQRRGAQRNQRHAQQNQRQDAQEQQRQRKEDPLYMSEQIYGAGYYKQKRGLGMSMGMAAGGMTMGMGKDGQHYMPKFPTVPGYPVYHPPHLVPAGKRGSTGMGMAGGMYGGGGKRGPIRPVPPIHRPPPVTPPPDECQSSADCPSGKACYMGICVTDGSLRFTLSWQGDDDLEFSVTTPAGITIDRANPLGDPTRGMFETDSSAYLGGGNVAENVYWPPNAGPESGLYLLRIDQFNCGKKADDSFVIAAVEGGTLVAEFYGVFREINNCQTAQQFAFLY